MDPYQDNSPAGDHVEVATTQHSGHGLMAKVLAALALLGAGIVFGVGIATYYSIEELPTVVSQEDEASLDIRRSVLMGQPDKAAHHFLERDGKMFFVNYNTGGPDLDYQEIKGADSETFQNIGSDYGRDKNSVFYQDTRLDVASPDGFSIQSISAVTSYKNKSTSLIERMDLGISSEDGEVFGFGVLLEDIKPYEYTVSWEKGKFWFPVVKSGDVIWVKDTKSGCHGLPTYVRVAPEDLNEYEVQC